MDRPNVNANFLSFIQNYNSAEVELKWNENSAKFRSFWNHRIMNDSSQDLSEEEMDEIIRILDRNAKGHTKENSSVAIVMIPQGAWYKMFREIKQSQVIKSLLNEILNENEESNLINEINELYFLNTENKNRLTGKSGNALNALLFAFNPKNFISVVSLNDRKRIIDYFEISIQTNLDSDSPGKKIVESNKAIIKHFRNLLGQNITPRAISDFLYLKLKSEWKNEIPDYQTVMLPIMEFASDGREHHIKELVNYISDLFLLGEEERTRRLVSGYDTIINNRVGWARTYLKKAGLLEDPRRGYFKITDRGREIMSSNPSEINVRFLMQFSEFREFQNVDIESDSVEEEEIVQEEKTPDELIAEGYKKLNENLYQDLLDKLRVVSPDFFEQIVVELLEKMGYGTGEVTGGPGDGGIDGIIYQDPLRMDKIYLQAKRYSENNLIGPNEILKFRGVLDNKGAIKGVFITTSKFHQNVKEAMSGTQKNIALIDGEKLVQLMVEYEVGVETDKVYKKKKIDSDYFEE